MPIEIERKFLVVDDSWRTEVRVSRHITDHLIARFQAGKARIRLCEDKATLTFKGVRKGLARSEYHIPLSTEDAAAMVHEFGTSPAIEKVRCEVLIDQLVWQVDQYAGALAGLVTADVELPSQEHVLAPPSWAGAEVTGDPRFSSGRLALALKEQGTLLEEILEAAHFSAPMHKRAVI